MMAFLVSVLAGVLFGIMPLRRFSILIRSRRSTAVGTGRLRDAGLGGAVEAGAVGRAERILTLASGAAVGMLLGLATSRVLSAIVYQASAQDPVVMAAVAGTILVTGALSVAGPVRRALQVNPAKLLRED